VKQIAAVLVWYESRTREDDAVIAKKKDGGKPGAKKAVIASGGKNNAGKFRSTGLRELA